MGLLSKVNDKLQFATYSCDGRVSEVQDALEVGPVGVDGRVRHEAGHVDAVVGGAGLDHVALRVDNTT